MNIIIGENPGIDDLLATVIRLLLTFQYILNVLHSEKKSLVCEIGKFF